MKKFILFILILPILSSCDTMKEAGKVLRNEKVNTTDEFLVKKREPLVLPPDYEKLPQPGERRKEEINKTQHILLCLIFGHKGSRDGLPLPRQEGRMV